ncbi:MAG: winged helix-turn-helix domain-containing protein [Candidatus Methanosuratincola sp.]
MVCLVVPDEKLAAVCSALIDDKSREVLLSLKKGPLTMDRMSEALLISKKDASDRLEKLVNAKLVRRIPGKGESSDLYALEFSIEVGDGKESVLAEELYQVMAESFYSFLDRNSEKVSDLCDELGASLGRAVEQIFLSAIAKIINDLQSEMLEEDKRLSVHLGGGSPT